MIFKNNAGKIFVLNIEETKLVEIFRDYLENMEESCFYSKEESVAMIRQIIDYLKKERTETKWSSVIYIKSDKYKNTLMYTEMLSTHQGISFSFSYSPDHLTVCSI